VIEAMMRRLGQFTVRRRRLVLAASVVFLAVAGALGGGVAEHLTAGGFEDPGSESAQAADELAATFGVEDPNLILLVTVAEGTIDDPGVVDDGRALTEELAAEAGVANVASYWSLGSPPPLRSEDATQALVLGTIEGDDDRVNDRVEQLAEEYTRTNGVVTVAVGGVAEVFNQVGHTIESDLIRAELIALPITLVLLVLVFRSFVAACIPLGVGAVAMLGTFLMLRTIAALTDVSIYALNLTTAMGLGLAIDYSLFMVSRYREELRRGRAPHTAVVRTVETAGRTVAFSALTVAVSLAALLVFPLAFLRSFAYAGIAVALVASAAAVVSLPALLAVLGTRVDKLALWHQTPKPPGESIWHQVATAVMRRPVPVATAVIVLLVALGLPFLGVQLALPDDRVQQEEAPSRQVHDELRENFTSNEASAVSVVATDTGTTGDAELEDYAGRLSTLDGVARVDTRTGSYIDGAFVAPAGSREAQFSVEGAARLSVVPTVEPMSPDAENLVVSIRDEPAPFDVQVGGRSARLVDLKDTIVGRLPLALGLIALATLVLLFLMFGSVAVPLKALVLNLLSLSATYGAMVWVFQDGHLSGVLDFTATGALDVNMPILMFCIAFGLSMDYEVFLLSRIKEEHDRTGDNTASVAIGLDRTGRLVTAAALLISVVFLAFATSDITFIKLFGVGLALAVLIDAFVIRATLVPAFMRLAGELNWWAPRPLRRLHERIGLQETVGDEVVLASESAELQSSERLGAP
jgi:RND superfamily putative drug exporter